jgi:hypothetical protein
MGATMLEVVEIWQKEFEAISRVQAHLRTAPDFKVAGAAFTPLHPPEGCRRSFHSCPSDAEAA